VASASLIEGIGCEAAAARLVTGALAGWAVACAGAANGGLASTDWALDCWLDFFFLRFFDDEASEGCIGKVSFSDIQKVAPIDKKNFLWIALKSAAMVFLRTAYGRPVVNHDASITPIVKLPGVLQTRPGQARLRGEARGRCFV
jgi:hypothetical protein